MDVRASLEGAARALADGAPSAGAARLEAELLLCHALGVERSFLFAHPEHGVEARSAQAFESLVKRRAAGEPVAYLVGRREFWSLPLSVTPDVLIPRAETELLVEAALERMPNEADVRVADLGTGSGAIALALATERPSAEVHATDVSAAAIGLARRNAAALGLGHVRFHPGSWCEPLQGRFHVIVSNPPYIAADDPHLQSGDLRFEPRAALTPGADPLAAIRAIAQDARDHVRKGGWLLLEHGMEQGAGVRALLASEGYADIETRRDLEGRERVTQGRWLGRDTGATPPSRTCQSTRMD